MRLCILHGILNLLLLPAVIRSYGQEYTDERDPIRVCSGNDFVAALANPFVLELQLVPNEVIVTESSFLGYEVPLVVRRNVTIYGWPNRYVRLSTNNTNSKVRLGNAVVLTVQYVVLDEFYDSLMTGLGASLFATMPPGEFAILHALHSGFISDYCFPPPLARAYSYVPRPTQIVPGVNLFELFASIPVGLRNGSDSCTNDTSVHVMQRCYAYVALFNDYAGNTTGLNSSRELVESGYVVHLVDTYMLCSNVLDDACVLTYNAWGCLAITKAAIKGTPPVPAPMLPLEPTTPNCVMASPPLAFGGGKGTHGNTAVGAAVGGTVGGVVLVGLLALLLARQLRRRASIGQQEKQQPQHQLPPLHQQPKGFIELRMTKDWLPDPFHAIPSTLKSSMDSPNKSSRDGALDGSPTKYKAQARLDAASSSSGFTRIMAGKAIATVNTTATSTSELTTTPEDTVGIHTFDIKNNQGVPEQVANTQQVADATAAMEQHVVVTPLTPLRTDLALNNDVATKVTLLPIIRGKGGYGTVCEGMFGGERVAVKILRDEAGVYARTGGKALQRVLKTFAQEVEVLGRCQHPNVVRLLAACMQPPRMLLVMELMDTSLGKLVHGNLGQLLHMEMVLHIATEIARALEYLHPTVVHRDLKPDNVLLSQADSLQPTVKVSDFGLSRLRSTVVPTSTPGAGTPAYLAPECFDTRLTVITHHVDVYAWASVVWTMLTGQEPWKGYSVVAIAYHVALLDERLPLDAAVAAGRCPPRLQRLLGRCWNREPACRPAAAEVVKEMVLIAQETLHFGNPQHLDTTVSCTAGGSGCSPIDSPSTNTASTPGCSPPETSIKPADLASALDGTKGGDTAPHEAATAATLSSNWLTVGSASQAAYSAAAGEREFPHSVVSIALPTGARPPHSTMEV